MTENTKQQNDSGIRGENAELVYQMLFVNSTKNDSNTNLKSECGITKLMESQIENGPIKCAQIDSRSSTTETSEIKNFCSLLRVSRELEVIPYRTISDYHNLYLSKLRTPLEIAQELIKNSHQFIKGASESDVVNYEAILEMNEEFILEQAEKSTERYQNGTQLSILDGVPFFTKEEIPVSGYISRHGSELMFDKFTETSYSVKQLLDAGSIHCGTTVMTMFGCSVIGCNPSRFHSSPKNPCNVNYYCGGSCCGCGCVVSAGLVPFTVSVDTAGSTRISAAICGVIGLKATFGRVSDSCHKIFKQSFATSGVMACSVRDASIVYGCIAGPDAQYEIGLMQPDPVLPNLFKADLTDYRFSTFSFYNQLSSIKVLDRFNRFLETLRNEHSIKVEECEIPQIKNARSAMTVLVMKYAKYIKERIGMEQIQSIKDIGSRISLLIGTSITDAEVVQAKKQRAVIIREMKKIFDQTDFIISLTVSSTAYKRQEGDESHSVMDSEYQEHCLRNVYLANLTGIPAITINLDRTTEEGLPIGIQIMAPWWKEDQLLRIAYTLEQIIKNPSHPLPHLGAIRNVENSTTS